MEERGGGLRPPFPLHILEDQESRSFSRDLPSGPRFCNAHSKLIEVATGAESSNEFLSAYHQTNQALFWRKTAGNPLTEGREEPEGLSHILYSQHSEKTIGGHGESSVSLAGDPSANGFSRPCTPVGWIGLWGYERDAVHSGGLRIISTTRGSLTTTDIAECTVL